MRWSCPQQILRGILVVVVVCAAWTARADSPRPAPVLTMSFDYDDWDLTPPATDVFLRTVKNAGFSRVHWRLAHEKGFLYRSTDAVTATGRLNSHGGPDYDPVRYGVRKGRELGLEIFSYVDAWENLGFLGKWGREHPDSCMMDRDGKRWSGGISYACPEGRAFRLIPVRETARMGVAGVYIENWSWHAGGPPKLPMTFEPPVADRYQQRYGVDPRTDPYDLTKLKQVQGEFYREFLIEAKKSLAPGQKLAFAYAFSQGNPMVHLPILDLKELVASRTIDVLILGVWWGWDYECWLTREGHDKAREWADFCHQHGAQFVAYVYTDNPYVATWERFGAPGVRARWKGDHGWLADTGLDGFTNRNVPECLCSHGAPGGTNRATMSKYLVPVGEQLWSGAAEGLQAKRESMRPLWTPHRLPDDAPVVLVLAPRSVRRDVYPLPHQADWCPETTGLVPRYRTLLANLGCRMELATTKDELDHALQSPEKHVALILGHGCSEEPWVKSWLADRGPLLDYVKRGGSLIASIRGDSPLAGALGLTCRNGVVEGGGLVQVCPEGLPAEMQPFLPNTLDLKRNVGGYSRDFLPETLLKPAPAAYDPSKLPDWARPILSMAGAQASSPSWPVMLAGRFGKGRILCATTPFLAREMVAINPADGPDVPEQIRVWQMIGHWLLPGRELPIDAAMRAQDRRFAAVENNLLANGGFEDGWIAGYPAYWMAQGPQPGTWVPRDAGVSLENRSEKSSTKCLRLEAGKVASLHSMTFPVRPRTEYRLTGSLRTAQVDSGAKIVVTATSGVRGSLEVPSAAEWTSFELPIQTFPSPGAPSGFNPRAVPAWIEITLPRQGTVWLDDLRVCSAAKCN